MHDFNLEEELIRLRRSPLNNSAELVKYSSWKDSLKYALKNAKEFEDFFHTPMPNISYPLFLPRPFAAKVKHFGVDSPMGRQFIPSLLEDNSELQTIGISDPIGDEANYKSGQIVHRYKNRALFLPTKTCAGICRFCFRKNNIKDSSKIFDSNFIATIDYLKRHLEIEELIFSGGDPFILSDDRLRYYLEQFHSQTLIRFIRFHTRIPVFMPERFDSGLLRVLTEAKRMFPVVHLVVHINHPDELDREVFDTLQKIKETGVEVLSQSVLLKGINDNVDTLKHLINKLILAGVRPYYLHHPDRVRGGMHFYLDLKTGRRIYSKLRNLVPGWALPQYILDIPGGKGKTPAYNPESFESSGRFLTKEGKIIRIKELTSPLGRD